MSEILFSYINTNDILRLDSNYFLKIFLEQEKKILNHNLKTLSEYKCNIKSFGAYSLNNYVEYVDSGVPFVRGINLKEGRIQKNDMIYISDEAHKLLWKSEVFPKTVLLSMSGTIGDVAIASEKLIYPINSNQDIAKITCNTNLNPYYLFALLLSKFGQNYLIREARGSVQQHVFLSQIEKFNVPQFSDKFSYAIEKCINLSDSYYDLSNQKYTDSETLVLNTLGLSNVTNQSEIFNIKSLHESFGKTGRLDAEYYQKKYEDVEALITTNPYSKLAQLVKIQKSIEPGSDAYSDNVEGLPFLRVADYNKFGITQPQKNLNNSFVAENYKKLHSLKPKKQTILFSKDGSVGQAYCLREDADFITSGAILHLTVKNPEQLLPDYLTLVLNSKLVQMQADRDVGGSIILHWRIREIEEVLIPLTDMKTQEKIASLVKESFNLKTESQRFLDVAKRAVEIAIEENEQSAIAFLQESKSLLKEATCE